MRSISSKSLARALRRATVVVAVIFLGMALAQNRGGSIHIAVTPPVASMDPHSNVQPGVGNITLNVFEGLLLQDYAGNFYPGLATSWSVSDDQLTYTFVIRQGVRFHDGSEMTAEDVASSLRRRANRTQTKWEVADWDRVEVVDDYTVRVVLSQPYTGLLDTLPGFPWASIMPAEIADRYFDEELPGEFMIGTGPYRLVDYQSQQWWQFERFEDYHNQFTGPHDGTAGERHSYLDSIRVTRVAEAGTRLAGLLAGDYDFVDEIAPDDIDVVDRAQGVRTYIIPATLGWYVKFNAVQGPMANEMLRRAVRVAIDPEEIMAGFGDERTWEVNTYPRFHPSSPYHLDANTMRYYPNDIELAKQMVAASGYNGEPIRWIASRDLAGWYIQAIGMIPFLEEIGLNVELVVVDRAAQLQWVNDNSAWEIKSSFSGLVRWANVFGFHGVHRSGDRWNWSDAEHQYWERQLFRDASQRDAAIKRLTEIELERAGQIWLGHTATVRGVSDRIQGVSNSEYTLFWTMWRD
jgi:peptide/nickel transport system substrate-binding protein